MAIPLLAAVPAVASAAYKFIAGSKQVKDGKRIEKNNKFTTYQRPTEVTEALNLAQRNLSNGMPGSDLYENRIISNAGAAFNAASNGASSSADIIDSATKIGMNTNRAMQDLGLQEDNFTQRALGQVTDQLNNNAAYSDKEFMYNIDQPYQRKAAAASALIGAGNQNKFSAVDDLMGVATSAIPMMGKAPTMGDLNGYKPIGNVSTVPVTNTMGGLKFNQPLNMGTKYGNSTIAEAGSVGLTNKSSFSNPSLMGKWIVDPATGAKRWSINGL